MTKEENGLIVFRAEGGESYFLDPRKDFSPAAEPFQLRFDPLTGRSTHYSHIGAVKAQRLPLEFYAEPAVKGYCPFCPGTRERAVPKFPSEVLPGGRLSRGEAFLFPNLYPYDVFSSVAVMTDDHVVPLGKLTRERLLDSLSVGIDFLKKVQAIDGSLRYHMMTWNYMPPSGGGLVHPHQQYFATNFPGNQFVDEWKASGSFFAATGRSYWHELIEAERAAGSRYAGQVGSSHWVTPFAALGMLGEVMCIFPDVYCLEDFGDGEMRDLVAGLGCVFAYFREADIFSFNASLVFGAAGQRFFSAHLRVIPRTFLNTRDFAPDFNFYQALLQEPITVIYPEDLCAALRPHFRG